MGMIRNHTGVCVAIKHIGVGTYYGLVILMVSWLKPNSSTKTKEIMRSYKDVLVGKNSLLAAALSANNKKLAEKIYKETTAKYCAMYSKEDRDWFANWRTNGIPE